MEIKEIKKNKKDFLSLLLLADEQESMIDKYLDRGIMFALYDENEVKCVCVVTDEGDKTLEIKNIATKPNSQRKGYAKAMINFIEDFFKQNYSTLKVGTGDSLLTIPFYEKCGFVKFDKIKNFFIDNYDHSIYECGVQLVDMIYLKKDI